MISTMLSAQVYVQSFDTVGLSEDGYEVSASGTISLYEGLLTMSIENLTKDSSLLGLWIKAPNLTIVSTNFITEPWDFQDSTPSIMNNLVKKSESDDYFGFMLDVSKHGWEPALQKGDILSLSMNTIGTLNEFVDSLDMVFRWQQVGPDAEDSAKTFLTFVPPINISIPEPSFVGMLTMAGLVLLPLRRKR